MTLGLKLGSPDRSEYRGGRMSCTPQVAPDSLSATRADGWVRGSRYHLALAGWTIAKVTVLGFTQYELWKGNECLGAFFSADDAKKCFADLNVGEPLYQPVF